MMNTNELKQSSPFCSMNGNERRALNRHRRKNSRGADDKDGRRVGARTPDLCRVEATLYQLSYAPMLSNGICVDGRILSQVRCQAQTGLLNWSNRGRISHLKSLGDSNGSKRHRWYRRATL